MCTAGDTHADLTYINLRTRSALVLELETKESLVPLITKLNNKTDVCIFTLMSPTLYPVILLSTTRHYFSRNYRTMGL